jgi:hypothetical protein
MGVAFPLIHPRTTPNIAAEAGAIVTTGRQATIQSRLR